MVRRSQQGAALAISLVFLTVITMATLAALRRGDLERQLSDNALSRIQARELAQGALDAARADHELAALLDRGRGPYCLAQATAQTTCRPDAVVRPLPVEQLPPALTVEVDRVQAGAAAGDHALFSMRARLPVGAPVHGPADIEIGLRRLPPDGTSGGRWQTVYWIDHLSQ